MKIHCKYDELVDTLELKPNPQNPNVHPTKQVKLLAKIIKENGWRAAIIVSKRSGYVVKGHGRLFAAKRAGFEKVPVEYQDYASKEEENADLLADNKLSELSKTDQALVTALLGEYDEDYDITLTGYTGKDLIKEALEVVELDEPEFEVVPVMDEKKSCYVIVCNTEEENEEIAEMLNVDQMVSYKNDKVAPTSVVTAKHVLEKKG